MLAVGVADGTVRLWDLATHKSIFIFRGHTDTVSGVLFSPDNTFIASGSRDKTVCFWYAWSSVQSELERVAFPFLQHGRLSPYTLLHIIDCLPLLQNGCFDCFHAQKMDWMSQLQRKLNRNI